jgi:acetyl-CoA carboxylase biotin carboxyl carrier protein
VNKADGKKTPKNPNKTTISGEKIHIDAAAVKELADLFKETDLSEIEYETAGCRIRVARNYGMPAQQHTTFFPPMQSPTILDATPEKQHTPIDPAKHPGAIKSPMVGTAYLSSQPGADPFIKVGGPVKEGDTVMIVEAMKVMNPIRAPRSGIVKEIMIQDGTPVEFDQALLIIE